MKPPSDTSKGRSWKANPKAGRLPPGVANPIDVHVGNRVRLRRTLLGLSQEKLGDAVGLTFQQIQKYERGANRIGASRLHEFSLILDVPVGYFFEEMPDEIKTRKGSYKIGMRDHGQEPLTRNPMARRETLEFVRNFYRINDLAIQKSLTDLINVLAKSIKDA